MLIYIELTESLSFNFSNPTLDTLKKVFHEHIILDLDNHSSSDTVHYISKSIDEYEELTVVINALEENTSQPQVLKLIQGIIKKKVLSFSIGKSTPLEKLLKARTEYKHCSLDQLLIQLS